MLLKLQYNGGTLYIETRKTCLYIDGLLQGGSKSSALALQSYT